MKEMLMFNYFKVFFCALRTTSEASARAIMLERIQTSLHSVKSRMYVSAWLLIGLSLAG